MNHESCPQSAITTILAVAPLEDPTLSIFLTTSIPSVTLITMTHHRTLEGRMTYLPKNHVFTVEPGCLFSADKELAAVGIRSRVGHRQDTRTGVLQLEVLVLELYTIDGLTASPVTCGKDSGGTGRWSENFQDAGTLTVGEVASLTHELRNDTMEAAAFEVKRLPGLADSLLASTEAAKVLSCDRDNIRG